MCYDFVSGVIVVMFCSFKMYGMVQVVIDFMEQGFLVFEVVILIFFQLFKVEIVEWEVWFVVYQFKIVCFFVYCDLVGFDFISSEVNEVLVCQLYCCDFIDIVDNIVLVGGFGIGKSYVVMVLGIQVIEYY